MIIVERAPKTRTQELIKFEDGSRAVRCYNKGQPLFYKNHNSELFPISFDYEKATSSKVGNIRIREKNVNSVGYREDSDPYKYLGIRPDENQELGTEQMEFTIKEIIVNDENIPIDLTKNEAHESYPHIINLGNVLIQIRNNSVQQIINPDRPIESFKITFLIHLKGLSTVNKKDEETGFFAHDEEGEFSFAGLDSDTEYIIQLPVLLDEYFDKINYYDAETDVVLDYENLTRHTLRDMGDGVLEYIKYSSGHPIPEIAKYIDVNACGGLTPCGAYSGGMEKTSKPMAPNRNKDDSSGCGGTGYNTCWPVIESEKRRMIWQYIIENTHDHHKVTTPTDTDRTIVGDGWSGTSAAGSEYPGTHFDPHLEPSPNRAKVIARNARPDNIPPLDSQENAEEEGVAWPHAHDKPLVIKGLKPSTQVGGVYLNLTQFRRQRAYWQFDVSDVSGVSLATFNFYVSDVRPYPNDSFEGSAAGQLPDGTFATYMLTKSTWTEEKLKIFLESTNPSDFGHFESVDRTEAYTSTPGFDVTNGQYNTVELNSTALNIINNSSAFNMAAMQYNDYLNDKDTPPLLNLGQLAWFTTLLTGTTGAPWHYITPILNTLYKEAPQYFTQPYLDLHLGYFQKVMGVDPNDIVAISGLSHQQVEKVLDVD